MDYNAISTGERLMRFKHFAGAEWGIERFLGPPPAYN